MIKFTLYMSAILGFICAEAAVIAILRIVRGARSPATLVGSTPEADARNRLYSLSAFALYLIGEVVRNYVIVTAGENSWQDVPLALFAGARVVQLSAACLFVWAITRQICGQFLWLAVLGAAVAFSIVVLR